MMDPYDKKLLIMTGAVFAAVVIALLGVNFVPRLIDAMHDDPEDVSLTHAVDQANDNGSIRIGASTLATPLGEWRESDYHSSYRYELYLAHTNGDTLVLERYGSDSKGGDRTLVNVYYYSVLEIKSVSFMEDGVKKYWYGGKI